MKCKICKKEAEIYLRSHNIKLCREHFIEFAERKVERAIKRYRMFSKRTKILVAVSGGKDSLVLWYILKKLGYKVIGYHIHLGIKKYSDESLKKVRNFATKYDLDYIVEYVKDEFNGYGIPEIAKITRQAPCSVCGVVKRYMMNRKAIELGACIATGHNLDDEVATLTGNLLHWQLSYIDRQFPVLEKKETLAKRVKPLIMLTERETASYAIMNDIDYIIAECPHSEGATSLIYKKVLNQLENEMPGVKWQFYTGFVKNKKLFKQESPKLNRCEKCGYLTVGKVCKFCKMKEKIENYTTLAKIPLK